MKSKWISDYAFLEENTDPSFSQKALMQAVLYTATLKTIPISAFDNKNDILYIQVFVSERLQHTTNGLTFYLFMFCCITFRTAAVFTYAK